MLNRLRWYDPPVDVDDVRQRVESEERDADRQRDIGQAQRAQVEVGKHDVHVLHGEIGVLEDGKQPDVENDRDRERHSPPLGIVDAVDPPRE